MRKIVFLDRDGTINVDKGYTHKIEDFYFEKNIVPALQLLRENDFEFIIVTNQSGIGRGLYSVRDFRKFNNHLLNELKKEGVEILKTYYSPYHPEKGLPKYKKVTRCRKPNPGMLEQAEKEFMIDKGKSWIIGDRWIDVKTGQNFGIKSILLLIGHGGKDEEHITEADFVAQDPLEAAKFIIKWEKENDDRK